MGRSGVGVLEEAADGLVGRQGHSGTHVGLAGHSWVGDPAGSGAVQQRQLHEEDEKGKRNTPNKSLVFG